MIRALRVRYLRWRLERRREHLRWVCEQLVWGEYAKQQAEAKYHQAYADLLVAEAPHTIIPQGSMSIKRRAA